MSRLLVALGSLTDGDGPAAGAKAVGLARMAAAGVPVPPGCVVLADAYSRHLEAGGLALRLRDLVTAAPGASGTGDLDADALGDFRSAIVDAAMDEGLAREIERSFDELGGGPMAVRSSATAEDLPAHSFAGQHGTYFVADIDSCLERVRHCWASLFSDRAVAYRVSRGFPLDAVRMAVVIQRLVRAEASGVVFTRDPVTGSDVIVVEACFGLGETLVSGRVTPDRFIFTRDGLRPAGREIAHKAMALTVGPDGAATIRRLGDERAASPAVSDELAREVARLAAQTEEAFAEPLDMEWAVEGGRVWFTQARPITAVGREGASATPAFAPSPAEAPIVWSNVNTGEILPDQVTPLTWSIIGILARNLIHTMFGSLGVRIDPDALTTLIAGRAYFNVTMLAAAFESLPLLGSHELGEVLGGMQELVDIPELGSQGLPPVEVSKWRLVAGAPRVLVWLARHGPTRAERYWRAARRDTDEAAAALARCSDEEELADLVMRMAGQLLDLTGGLAYSAVGMAYYGGLARLCRRWLDDETGSLTNRLLAAQGGVLSAEAGLALWGLADRARAHPPVEAALREGRSWKETRAKLEELAAGRGGAGEFLARWDSFMVEHGHHARGELELGTPRWSERPDYVLSTVRSYLDVPRGQEPGSSYEGHALAGRRAEQESARRLGPLRRLAFRFVLRQARRGARARENVKSEAARGIAVLRRGFLELGAYMEARGAIERADDILFLRVKEIEPVRTGAAAFDAKGRIAARRAEYVANEKLKPPPVVVGDWDGTDLPLPDDGDTETLKGLAVSSGVVRGPARVLETVKADEPVRSGEILVAPFTDPGWTPYFIPAAGIVMDMGGMLSHGSIIAREYGIPAVVNVGVATSVIRTGQLIEVDGDTGVVRLLGDAGE